MHPSTLAVAPSDADTLADSATETASTSSGGRRSWVAGTLVYGAGGLVLLFLLLLTGDFAQAMKDRTVVPLVQMQLIAWKTSDTVFGIFIVGIPSLITLALTPAISCWSDQYRSRWGRRIPFLAVPTPIAVVAITGLAFAGDLAGVLNRVALDGSPEHLRWATLGILALCWTLFEVATVTVNAAFTGLINDVVPRPLIGRFFGLFRIVSLSAGIAFNACLIGHGEQHYQTILLGIGGLYAVGFALMCGFVKEGTYPPPVTSAPMESGGISLRRRITAYIADVAGSPYLVTIMVVWMLGVACFAPVNSYSMQAAKSFGLSMEAYGQCFAWSMAASLILAFPLGWLTDRFHPLRTGLAVLALYALGMLACQVLVDGPTSYLAGLAAHVILSGAYFTTTAGLLMFLFPQARFAQFTSAATILGMIASGACVPLVGFLLDALDHRYGLTFLIGGLIAGAGCLVWLHLIRLARRQGIL